MDRNDLMMQIVRQVTEGHDIICSWPRRAGKTELTAILIDALLAANKKVAVYTDWAVMRDEIKRRMSVNKVLFFGSRSVDRLRGHKIDVLIGDEISRLDRATFALMRESCGQFVFFMTPIPYDPFNVPFCKKLWDTYPAIKFQMTPSIFMPEIYEKANPDYWHPEHYQTEVEGNWVCADGW